MEWKTVLAYITGTVDQELLLRNEYLVAENRMLRNQITGRVRLTDGERTTLAAIGKRLGKQALAEVVSVVTPEALLAWHRRLIAKKFDSSQHRRDPGRPRCHQEIEDFVVQCAKENRTWGYDRIVGALKNVGYTVSDQTVGNILKRQDIPPGPIRKKTTTWREFIRSHRGLLAATDFFTAEVWTKGGLVTYYILFFIQRLFTMLQSQGMQMNQSVTFFSDGGETVRELQGYLNPQAVHILDWFHLTMRLTVMRNMAKSLDSKEMPDIAQQVDAQLERIKWFLWNGNVLRAQQTLEEVEADVDLLEGDAQARKFLKAMGEFDTYIANNAALIPNYGDR